MGKDRIGVVKGLVQGLESLIRCEGPLHARLG